ncbi:DUF1993 domain-containing protein [Chelatococcus reniformis]|uniref:DUF1993 domain-containing protein n=1 Tax=Chelatococcus reniformis TaxID=1494448 RepID=A0A916U5L3_9HYPH|nr:DUF1993 domain-containing protein [Chelatococcus reniformis]GGC60073.1 hypothetical protein GCM10010994_18430 [Chelatococcus reniformis]
MSISFYDVSIGRYLQTTAAVRDCLAKGAAFCAEKGIDPQDLVTTRLYDDMYPLRFQLISVVHHSLGAVEGLRKGVFTPPPDTAPHDYAGLQQLVAETHKVLGEVSPDEIDKLEGGDLVFTVGGRQIPFVARDFILSFSLPNFYFHATTAYDILRHRGVPLGKRDYMGRLAIKA